MQTPELRASLEFAYRIFFCDMDMELYVRRDGLNDWRGRPNSFHTISLIRSRDAPAATSTSTRAIRLGQ